MFLFCPSDEVGRGIFIVGLYPNNCSEYPKIYMTFEVAYKVLEWGCTGGIHPHKCHSDRGLLSGIHIGRVLLPLSHIYIRVTMQGEGFSKSGGLIKTRELDWQYYLPPVILGDFFPQGIGLLISRDSLDL